MKTMLAAASFESRFEGLRQDFGRIDVMLPAMAIAALFGGALIVVHFLFGPKKKAAE